jgi:ribosomal protein L37AE/L43A
MENVLICPKCGSTNIQRNNEPTVNRYDMVFINKYECNDCKYEGLMPEINENDIDEFRNEIKENSSIRDIAICPKCGNTNFKKGGKSVGIKICLNCDYSGTVPLIKENLIEEFKNHLKEYKNNTN